MIDYAIFVVMLIFTIGFAWLWLIEQQKKKRVGKTRLSDDESHSGASRSRRIDRK